MAENKKNTNKKSDKKILCHNCNCDCKKCDCCNGKCDCHFVGASTHKVTRLTNNIQRIRVFYIVMLLLLFFTFVMLIFSKDFQRFISSKYSDGESSNQVNSSYLEKHSIGGKYRKEHSLNQNHDYKSLPIGEKLKKIKLVSIDIDGTLSDGKMYVSETGLKSMTYNTKDLVGIYLLKAAGIKTAIITGSSEKAAANLASNLHVDFFAQGVVDKNATLTEIMQAEELIAENVLHIGDDINDIGAFEVAGLDFVVRDYNKTLLNPDYVCRNKGGEGAVREMVDMLLRAKDIRPDWDLIEEYISKQ